MHVVALQTRQQNEQCFNVLHCEPALDNAPRPPVHKYSGIYIYMKPIITRAVPQSVMINSARCAFPFMAKKIAEVLLLQVK